MTRPPRALKAARLAELGPSPIRVLAEGAAHDAIPFGLGEPAWELPEPARRALARFTGRCPYGPNAGLPELRRAIAAYHADGSDAPRGATRVDPDDVLVTVGSEGALFALFHALLDPGDVVLVPDPGFPAYPALARLAGAGVATYALAADDRFRLDADAFERALAATPSTKLAIVNHPSNPTGAGASSAALARVAAACRAAGVTLISDEVYRELHYGTRGATALDVDRNVVVVSSVSKGFGAPGLRVGWAIGPRAILDAARVVHGFAVTGAAYPSQLAATALLEAKDDVLPAARREIAARFDALRDSFARFLDVAVEPPDGAFYHWLPLPAAGLADPFRFCVRVRDEGKVVLVPGDVFGGGGARHARLSFAARPEQVVEGVKRLAPFWTGA